MFLTRRNSKNKPRKEETRESSGPPNLDLTSRGNVTMPVVTTTRRCNGKWSINKVCSGKSLGCSKSLKNDNDNQTDSNQSLIRSSPVEPDCIIRPLSPGRDYSPDLHPSEDYISDDNSIFTYASTTTVLVEREHGSLGITLRGGFNPKAPDLSVPITITYIKPDGPVGREGTIQVGDRLLAVDNRSLNDVTLKDAQVILSDSSNGLTTKLCIEYDVSLMNNVRQAGVPLLVEVESPRPQNLGLVLTNSRTGVVVQYVKPGRIAERCGALLPGDEILAINETLIEGSGMTAEDVHRFLQNCGGFGNVMRLEILPKSSNDLLPLNPSSPYNVDPCIYEIPSLGLEWDTNVNWMVSHAEHLLITLQNDNSLGFGLSLKNHAHYANSVVVAAVEVGSPADRCGCIQKGDKILSINQRPVVMPLTNDAVPLNHLVNENDNLVTLEVEFNVADSVIPSSGVFTVKLAKNKHSNLGITIQAQGAPDNNMIISDIGIGTVAHRSGTLLPGDRILSVNNHSLHDCSIDQASQILHSSTDVVSLVVQRDSSESGGEFHRQGSVTSQEQDQISTEFEETCSSSVSSHMNSKSRTNTLPNHKRSSSLSKNINNVQFFDDSILPPMQPEFTFSTFFNNSKLLSGKRCPSETPGVIQVTLFKDLIYEDFGFSVSDGLYERGVFINRIRRGGPADMAKPSLKQYDRIIQVNDTRTEEFDCCLTVPLIASSGDCIHLTLFRHLPRSSMSPSIATSKGTCSSYSKQENNKRKLTFDR